MVLTFTDGDVVDVTAGALTGANTGVDTEEEETGGLVDPFTLIDLASPWDLTSRGGTRSPFLCR